MTISTEQNSSSACVNVDAACDGADKKGYFVTGDVVNDMKLVNSALSKYSISDKAKEEPLFLKDNKLVVIEKSHNLNIDRTIYRTVAVDKGRLELILTSAVGAEQWAYNTSGKNYKMGIPSRLLETVLSAGRNYLDGSVKELNGIHSGVLLTPSGKIVTAGGYNEDTGLYLTKDYTGCVGPLPPIVTGEDVAKAKKVLWDIFGEFNFVDKEMGEESVHYQNTIAAVFTMIVRPTWKGSLPLWVVSKSSERSGGSLLQTVAGVVAYGSAPVKGTFPEYREEYEKMIDSYVNDGVQYAMIDNVVEGKSWVTPALLSLSTGDGCVSGRVFGAKTIAEHPPSTFFAFNGINIEMRADVTGRVIVTSIVPDQSWQSLKYSMSETALINLATKKHPEVVRSFAIFYRWWKQNGNEKPNDIEGNFDAHQKWCDVIMAVLNSVGYENIMANLKSLQIDDNDAEHEHAEMLKAISNKFDVGVTFPPGALALYLMEQGQDRKDNPGKGGNGLMAFPEKIISCAMNSTLTPTQIGIALSKIKDRIVPGVDYHLVKKNRDYVLVRNVKKNT